MYVHWNVQVLAIVSANWFNYVSPKIITTDDISVPRESSVFPKHPHGGHLLRWPAYGYLSLLLLRSGNSFSYWIRLTRTTNTPNTVDMILYSVSSFVCLDFETRRTEAQDPPAPISQCVWYDTRLWLGLEGFCSFHLLGQGYLILSKASDKAVRTSERLSEIPECQGTVSRGLDHFIHNHVSR